MENVLECANLTKMYGKKAALNGLNLTVPKGSIVGLLGPNGAGKTTLMKLIVALLRNYKGTITVGGQHPGVETKKIVSYLPDREFLYSWMSIEECIDFYHHAFADFQRDKACGMIEMLGLNLKDKVKSLSKGMQERVSLSLTFARRAQLFVLDEPLAAVDPSTRDKIMQIILDNFDPDSSILISTHLIRDVESLFTHIAIVDEGRVQLQGSVEELKREYGLPIEDLFKSIV
ncbi:multidrug ABC transporter ATP-binding protein [Paenibacillus sp. FSL H7-0357]|uniref:ABC transporter ATP-binding protein n=1 Tax=Paenibacillus sp. FSL H7-0357 TaxID=1536774 RepID=UPI0004F62AA4|nr:ABC transporter ATP-binding protein [Paenibacillus sp. FSL H7-0357]AIQ16974.1 multidrug ABC transporter ATP-binding protein [Paenibacillus sp. FSL H7-0357]